MRKYWFIAIGFLAIVACVLWMNGISLGGFSSAVDREIDFNFHIRPILVQKCYLCHGPDPSSRKAGLRLDTFEGATALLEDSTRAIIPGDPEHSTLVWRINHSDPNTVMPPPETKQPLTQQEIDLLTKWIKQGANWKPHWAFIPPKRVEPDDDFENPIDYFIQEKIDEHRLSVAPRADKHQLIRRVAYLLTGLPPSPEELDVFLKDNTEGAYERMVDRYLDSKAFGERWARHWMDVVRYAETKGHEFDFPIAGAWRYRDYLIRAFNDNVPYDQMVREHLAGDLLENPRRDSATGANESHVATAFFTFSEGTHSPVDVRADELERIDNIIDVTSKTFQALTISCARCHDHKFDPIKTSEYYALFGVIESTRFSPRPVSMSLEQVQSVEKHQKFAADVREMIGKQWASSVKPAIDGGKLNVTPVSQYERKIAEPVEVLGDFRGNTLGAWKSDGFAFGNTTTLGEPVWSRNHQIVSLSEGKASSRIVGTGVFGALRSPNFVIDKDFIGVRALGKSSTIRIIIDNFQLIRYPIYGGIEQKVDSPGWKDFVFDVKLWKGHKAYIEILPGVFSNHVYKLPSDAFVEVQYAIAYNDKWTEPRLHDDGVNGTGGAVARWIRRNNTPSEIALLNKLIKAGALKNRFPETEEIVREQQLLAQRAADTTAFFDGVVDGFSINSHVFIRGSYKDPSPQPVPRRFLSAIPVADSVFDSQGSGRLNLANAVLSDANPLTARVMVNRIWHHVFGRGIVETVDNFGLQGKLPTHPELLDFIAIKFREDGWSIKSMIRLMMTSETFQRSVEADQSTMRADPNNLYLARYPIRRLEAEAIRDGMLAVSGELNREMYGPPVRTYFTEFMEGRGKPSRSGPLDGNGRRSIYQEVRRNFLSPMMTTFDLPIPFSTFGKRDVTNVPAQSLILMNDPFVHLQAEKMAQRLLEQKGLGLEDRIHWIYKRAFSRTPNENEMTQAKAFIRHLAALNEVDESAILEDLTVWKDYCHSVFNLKEFIYLI